ncbi:MAG: type I methionyl aminopeptidase [Candidatus Izimaplasma sp.]|nr:type I methionyl aminopeptidase [Candidatus Izimaplasma bacterium]
MVTVKSQREIDLMKKAGKIVAKAHEVVSQAIRPGITTKELDTIVEQTIIGLDAEPSFKGYGGFPASACISINEEVVHGIPKEDRTLKNGDIVSIDIGAEYKGYHGDSAWTYKVGTIDKKTQDLLDVTKQSLFEGLKQATAGNRLTDISHAIQTYAETHGFSVVREFVGHGLGRKLHEDPQIPNFGLPNKGIRLKEGMTFAIEPMINMGRKDVKVLEDNWTAITIDGLPSAHFEHSILITSGKPVILTQGIKEE